MASGVPYWGGAEGNKAGLPLQFEAHVRFLYAHIHSHALKSNDVKLGFDLPRS